jgi:polyphosphate kinase
MATRSRSSRAATPPEEAAPEPAPLAVERPAEPTAPAPPQIGAARRDLSDPALFINRELSQLEFNFRVLAQAEDPRVPLLERLRYLAISSTNLDEFFEIRVAGLREQLAYSVNAIGPEMLSPQEALARVSQRAHELVDRQYRVLNDALLPAMVEEGIRIRKRGDLMPEQREWVNDHFSHQVLPVLTPMGLDPAHPFPRILNKALTFIISLDGADAFGRDSGIAVLQVPRCLPRLIALPKSVSESNHEFVLLSSVIHAHIGELFPGMRVTGCHQFRVTRDSDLWVDEEESQDLLAALKGELPNRKWGEAVRIEVDDKCKTRITKFLLQKFNLTRQDMYRVNGPVNLHRLDAIYDLVAART